MKSQWLGTWGGNRQCSECSSGSTGCQFIVMWQSGASAVRYARSVRRRRRDTHPYASTNHRRALWKDRDGHCWSSTKELVRTQVCSNSL